MATTTSKVSKVGNNFYSTSVTTNTDGSLKATTSRTDAQGNSGVPVSTVNTTSAGVSTRTFESGATAAETAAFNNPNSPERQAYTQQVTSQSPFGTNPTAEQQKATNAAAGTPNAATSTAASSAAAAPGSTPVATPASGALSAGSFVYPANLAQSHQDIIKFNLIEYIPGGIPGGTTGGGGRPAAGNILGTVVLPVPNNISDTNAVEWGADSMSAVQAAVAAAAFETITGGVDAGLKSAQESLTAIGKDSEGVKTALGSFFAAAAMGGEGAKLLSRASGQIINPNLELLFNAPTLRPFSFTFKLAARSESEGQTILNILRFFKKGMSPQRTPGNLFLKSPNTFTIQYMKGTADNPNIGKIKECALQSVTTSYTPEGQYATFSDGVMVSYLLQMTFTELEPIFNEDYEGLPGIGY
jgi:hypothetical protein